MPQHEIETFHFDGAPVRGLMHNGEAHFIAKDVAELLGYTNPRKAVGDHCKGSHKTLLPSVGGPQHVTIIPERDVYRLILRSKLPAAERFEEWSSGPCCRASVPVNGLELSPILFLTTSSDHETV